MGEAVPTAVAYRLIAAVMDPASVGLEHISGQRWGRLENDRVVLLELQLMKGMSIAFRWGVSLPYLPHALLPKVRHHRTLKSARADLGEHSMFASAAERRGILSAHARPVPRERWKAYRLPSWVERHRITAVSTLSGETTIVNDAQELWPVVRESALGFWARTDSVAGVLAEAVGQIPTEHFHNPAPAYVAAFAASRLGRAAEAAEHLRHPVIHLSDDELAVARRLVTTAHT